MISYRKYILVDLNNDGIKYFENKNCDTKKLVGTKYIVIGEKWNLKNAYREVFGDTIQIEKIWREWRPEPNEIVKMIKILSQINFQTDKKQIKRDIIIADLISLL